MTEDQEFWDSVDHGDPDRCWPWRRGHQTDGYGMVRWNGRPELAHRVAFGLSHGDFDLSLKVRHRCDNPPCCNPAHLELGMQADNVRDMYERGRNNQVLGERHGMAKLSSEDVREIRAWFAVGGWTKQDLADAFVVSDSQIGNIVRGRQRRAG